ncbi:leucine-rich repeat protein, putative [Bodo saltans]|uniref:Leucine-rich repeat protein, putative n=1 Tax=Bodo saltans TaxID=75058 RepID=A0A0S4ILR9_BODSA|nr:leucine-rich repeat protein, putative [Bodo saltans]|eukprot:CUF31309.1 leucine-rich repeat protein, putative [Bodo saltans]
MPLPTRLEGLMAELLTKGKPQMLHYILAKHPVQQKNVVQTLVTLSKKSFVDLKEPSSSAAQADWQSLSTKKLWVVCTFGSATNAELMRQAAVEVLCARTNNFCPLFRVIVLLSNESEYENLPVISRALSGLKSGQGRFLDLGQTSDANPVVQQNPQTGEILDCGMRIVDPQLEEWLDYTNVEDAAGDVAELQERIFNSEPDVKIVKYSTQYGRGGPYIRILRDALKFNIVVHTLDLTGSECGDVVGSCLASILYTSRKLKTIILDSCSLTDVGVLHVAQAVRTNEFVKTLTLSRNPSMTDASLIAIASIFSRGTSTNLTALDISYNNIVYDVRFEWTPAALSTLWNALGEYQRLQKINVASCGLNHEHLLEAAHRWLSAPTLSSRSEEGSHAKTTTAGHALTDLNLSHNYLGDEVVTTLLRYLTGIRKLNLEHVQLGGCGFRAIGFAIREWNLPVEVLNLDANNASLERTFNDEIALAGLGCSTSHRAAAGGAVTAATVDDPTQVSTVPRDEHGAVIVSMDTAGDDIPESQFEVIKPHRHPIQDPPEDAEDVVDPTTALLRAVSDATLPGARYAVECLTGNRCLHTISLSRSMIGDEAVTTLCEMMINNLCAVRHVDISGNTNVEETSAHKIKELLVGGYFSKEEVEEVPQQELLPQSTTTVSALLSASEESRSSSPSSPASPASPLSMETALVAAQTGPRGSAENPIVMSMNLSSNSTAIGERALLALYFNKGLRVLNISNMALVDAMLLPLNEGMKQNPHLRISTLIAGRNCLWYDGVANIAGHLEQSTTLTTLSLENTWDAFDDEAGRPTRLSKTREEGLYYLSPLLRVLGLPSCTLEVLDLSRNDISEVCARGIAKSIVNNSRIKAIWLRDNPAVTVELLAEIGDPRIFHAFPK